VDQSDDKVALEKVALVPSSTHRCCCAYCARTVLLILILVLILVLSSTHSLIPAKSALVASYRTIFKVFENYREEYGGYDSLTHRTPHSPTARYTPSSPSHHHRYDSMPDSCAGLLTGMGIFVDYDEVANKFLEWLGAKRLNMKVNSKQSSQEFFAHILMNNAATFIQPDHHEAFKCTMMVISKVLLLLSPIILLQY
jgi:hypothetical protein